MSESADELANLAESLNEAETLEVADCPSLAQVLWESLANMPTPEAAARFTGFDGIELTEQP